jgi:hypothetical protein
LIFRRVYRAGGFMLQQSLLNLGWKFSTQCVLILTLTI